MKKQQKKTFAATWTLKPALGHDYGAGRSTAKHADKRSRRRRTRSARRADALKGW